MICERVPTEKLIFGSKASKGDVSWLILSEDSLGTKPSAGLAGSGFVWDNSPCVDLNTPKISGMGGFAAVADVGFFGLEILFFFSFSRFTGNKL